MCVCVCVCVESGIDCYCTLHQQSAVTTDTATEETVRIGSEAREYKRNRLEKDTIFFGRYSMLTNGHNEHQASGENRF